jgi:hypothetical protein
MQSWMDGAMEGRNNAMVDGSETDNMENVCVCLCI